MAPAALRNCALAAAGLLAWAAYEARQRAAFARSYRPAGTSQQ
jgi:hypothetical protein